MLRICYASMQLFMAACIKLHQQFPAKADRVSGSGGVRASRSCADPPKRKSSRFEAVKLYFFFNVSLAYSSVEAPTSERA